VNPAELSPGEFAALVRCAVEQEQRRIVVIDSLNGYQNAMSEERFLSSHLHELLAYLNQRGILTLMVMAQHGILGSDLSSPVDLSYLADNVILLRYFELSGSVRKAVSVVKKRTGGHERAIRELLMGPGGVSVGRQLAEFQGVLTGQLTYTGTTQSLREEGEDHAGR
jgi:circadian clock protein KaiC